MKHVHIFDHEEYHKTLKGQVGHGLPVFVGYRQKGAGLGNILGFIRRYAIPLISKYVLPHAESSLRGVANDIVSGKPISDALKTNALTMVKNVGKSVLKNQSGGRLRPSKGKTPKSTALILSKPLREKVISRKKKSESKKVKTKSKKKPSKKSSHLTKCDIFG